jgi:hypothetical protein
MKQREQNHAPGDGRLAYSAPEITDLGSVVDLTEANQGGTQYDGAGYAVSPHSS